MTSPLRVAIVAASPAIVGGHSVQAQGLAARLCASGHEVVYIPIDVRFPRPLRWMRRVRYVRTFVNEVLFIAALARIMRTDVVHVFAASYWSFLLAPAPAIALAKLLRKRVILHYHSGEADDHLQHWRSARPFLRLADEIVVPSGYLKNVFASHGYSARVIVNGIDPSQFRYRERTSLQPRLLSARNLHPYYRIEIIIAAFARLKERFPGTTLTIIGQGSSEQALRRLADELRVSGINFVGAVDAAAIADVYDAADIFVNASVVDNQPVSILEAFASGLPVVSTATGDIGSMLRSGEAGLLVSAENPEAIAEAVTRLLTESDLAIRLVRRARNEVERYHWQHVGDQWNALYAALLRGKTREVLVHGS